MDVLSENGSVERRVAMDVVEQDGKESVCSLVPEGVIQGSPWLFNDQSWGFRTRDPRVCPGAKAHVVTRTGRVIHKEVSAVLFEKDGWFVCSDRNVSVGKPSSAPPIHDYELELEAWRGDGE